VLMTAVPADLGVREGRDRYLAENGFSTDAYKAPSYTVELGGLHLRLPNTVARQRAIPLHDLHHVATGFGTDLVGEAEIGAWELRAGCNSLVTYWLNGMAALIGLFIAPSRTLRALARARGQRTLYLDSINYDALLGLTVGELRARLGIPPDGLADRRYGLHRKAPRRAH
jgi:hypothetical protein